MKKSSSIQKRIILQLVFVCMAVAGVAQVAIPEKLRRSIVSNRIPSHIQLSDEQLKKIMIKKIDLTASDINFSVFKCKDKFNAYVKVEGVVKNTGGKPYTTGANQQTALLYEDNGGRMQLVASQPFANLAPGAEVKLSFTRAWNISSPAEGEFPPKYVLVIGFDPDIYIDGNDNNDDSNNSNNRLTKSSAEVRTIWPCK